MRKAVTQDEKYQQMTGEPIPKLVGTLALPSILSMLVTSVYNMADTYFVGQLGTGTQETAAIGVIFPLMSIIQAVGFTFGHGSGNYIARALGAKDITGAQEMATTGFVSSFLVGAFISAISLLFLQPLVILMGASETIAPYAIAYATYILLAAPFMTSSFTLNNQLRYQGNAFYGMIALATGAVVNIALDPLFIFYFKMGVAGAALATSISQVISFLLLVWGTTRGGSMRIQPFKFRFRIENYKEILKGGLPSLWRQGLQSVAAIALNVAARPFGDAAIAAMSIVTRITGVLFSTMLGFGQGFQPVSGFNYGAKKYTRVQDAFWFAVKAATGVLLVVCIVCFIFAAPIVTWFRKDDMEVILIGTQTLRYQLLSLPLMGFTTLAMMMAQTIGKPIRASLLAASRQGFFFLPFILILPQVIGITGIMISQALADAFAFVFALFVARSVIVEMKQEQKSGTAN